MVKKLLTDHALCMQLCIKYLYSIAENPDPEMLKGDFQHQLIKYQPDHIMGQGFNGRTWIMWFLDSYMPEYLKKENE